MKYKSYWFYFIFLILFLKCTSQPELYNNQVAQLEIEAAVDAKREKCGPEMKPPQKKSPYPKPRLLVYQKKVPVRNIRLCSAAILRSDCPFVDYPIICIYVYLPAPPPRTALFNFNKTNQKNRFKPDDYIK